MQTNYLDRQPTTETFDSVDDLRTAMDRNLNDDNVTDFTVTMNRAERRRQKQDDERKARRDFRRTQRQQKGK
jgi:hypothetical protein